MCAWLEKHDGAQHSTERFENLSAYERTRLLLLLATEGSATEALILDNPDRHGSNRSSRL